MELSYKEQMRRRDYITCRNLKGYYSYTIVKPELIMGHQRFQMDELFAVGLAERYLKNGNISEEDYAKFAKLIVEGAKSVELVVHTNGRAFTYKLRKITYSTYRRRLLDMAKYTSTRLERIRMSPEYEEIKKDLDACHKDVTEYGCNINWTYYLFSDTRDGKTFTYVTENGWITKQIIPVLLRLNRITPGFARKVDYMVTRNLKYLVFEYSHPSGSKSSVELTRITPEQFEEMQRAAGDIPFLAQQNHELYNRCIDPNYGLYFYHTVVLDTEGDKPKVVQRMTGGDTHYVKAMLRIMMNDKVISKSVCEDATSRVVKGDKIVSVKTLSNDVKHIYEFRRVTRRTHMAMMRKSSKEYWEKHRISIPYDTKLTKTT